jgi:hypothetical protein
MTPELDRTGSIYGCQLVLERSTEFNVDSTGRKRFKWVCECQTCGAIHHYRSDTLLHSHREGVGHCKSCMSPNAVGAQSTSVGKYCRTCCDLPHRRPTVGLCRCGKAFEAEVFGTSETYRGRSLIADCEAVL